MLKRASIALLLFVVCAGLTGTAQVASGVKVQSKSRIDGAILQVIQDVLKGYGGSLSTARSLGVPFDGSTVTVTVVFNGRSAFGASAAALSSSAVAQAFGNRNVISAQSKSFLRLRVPVSLLPLIEQLTQLIPNVAYIRPPLVPQTLTVSEGVGLIGADALQSAGNLGQGTKVAIIDLGFSKLSAAKARGELPSNVITRDFTGSGVEFGTAHGTAVAEIVHDMAPNAQLYLMKIGDEIDLENAVNEAISRGINIINHSVGWFNTSYYDGTGPIANIVQTALSAGILWVNSAGNYAQRHYKGTFRDANANGWMEFSGSDESLNLEAKAGDTVQLYLTWRDWPLTAQDYDLALFDARGNQVAVSDKTQNGSQQPTESLRYFVPSSGTYRVKVKVFNAPAPKEITLFSLFQDLEHAVAQSSLVTPADVNGTLSVAAVRRENWGTGPQAPYSSQGPTNDGRPKPDIAGPDNVSTFSLGAFEGTSAAAPHVAGAAALLLSQNTNMNAAQLRSALRAGASSVGSPLATGAGRVRLTPTVTQRPDLTVLGTTFSPRTPNVGDTLQYEITVRNQGGAAAGSFVVRLQDQAGSTQQTVPGLGAGASVRLNFSRRLNLSSETLSVTVDASNQVQESNESNNTSQFQVTGSNTPPPPPPPANNAPQGSVQTDKPRYQIGDALRITFSTNVQAYAYLYNVDANGQVGQVFPNVFSRNNRVGPGTHTLPDGGYRFTVTGPLGTESLHLLLSLRPLNLALDGLQNSRFTTPQVFSDELQRRAGAQLGSGQWSVQFITVQVGNGVPVQPTNQRPHAAFTLSPATPLPGQVVTFDASGSSDPDGQIVQYRWDFDGNGSVDAQGVRASTSFAFAGTFNVTLSVIDNQGQSAAISQPVSVRAQALNAPPVAQFSFSPTQPRVGEIVLFDASASVDPDGQIVQYRWDLNSDGRVDVTGPRVSARFNSARNFLATLTVIDDRGASSSSSQTVNVGQRPTNQPPQALFSFAPNAPTVNERITFDASTSRDDGSIVDYRWDFNSDGHVDAIGLNVATAFNTPGTFTVTLTVVDNAGLSNSTQKNITVTNPSAPTPVPTPATGGALSSDAPGIFFLSNGANQLRVVVQGDPSWSAKHTYLVQLAIPTGSAFGNVASNPVGDATASVPINDERVVRFTGGVGNGRAEFNVTFRRAPTLLVLTVNLDLNGDGTVEKEVAFVVVGNKIIKAPSSTGGFRIQTQGNPIFPFKSGTTLICADSARSLSECGTT